MASGKPGAVHDLSTRFNLRVSWPSEGARLLDDLFSSKVGSIQSNPLSESLGNIAVVARGIENLYPVSA
jgi:hypothetical protein